VLAFFVLKTTFTWPIIFKKVKNRIMTKTLASLALTGLFTISCIQVPLGNTATESYKKIKLKAPKNFTPVKASGSDQAWIKSKNGNIISYRTECPSQVRSVEAHFNNISSDFLNSEVLSIDRFQFNNRTALRYKFTGDLESIKTSYDLVGFKKYGCLFIIAHNGRDGALSETSKDFEQFLEDFKVLQ
jgi:hypothetical protein